MDSRITAALALIVIGGTIAFVFVEIDRGLITRPAPPGVPERSFPDLPVAVEGDEDEPAPTDDTDTDEPPEADDTDTDEPPAAYAATPGGLQQATADLRPALRACWEAWSEGVEDPPAKVKPSILLGAGRTPREGAIRSLSVEVERGDPDPLERCMLDVLADVEFTEAPDDPVLVKIPMTFGVDAPEGGP